MENWKKITHSTLWRMYEKKKKRGKEKRNRLNKNKNKQTGRKKNGLMSLRKKWP